MGLVASVLNSQTVLRGYDQEKTVKCSISSSPVPWVRRWVRNVIRTFEQGGSLTVTQLYVTKPHPLSGNFMDWKEMTAVRKLQFKPNPTTKRRVPRQTKCQRKFSSEQVPSMSLQGEQGNKSAHFSFMPPVLPYSTSILQKHEKNEAIFWGIQRIP